MISRLSGKQNLGGSVNILVTGGAGFIGSNFIRLAINNMPDCRIVNLDKLTYAGNLENLKDIENHPNYKFIKGDICDKKLVDEAMKDVEIVFNLAAESHVDNSIKDPFIFTKTNVIGTHTLLESARKNNVKVGRFFQVLYQILLGTSKGPRLGPYILDIGKKAVIKSLAAEAK